uniref:WYL domain-containing protein n=1 Tax=Schlesneria paludicola TaxID=360056 RepID=A0A7C4QXF9_9PLAN
MYTLTSRSRSVHAAKRPLLRRLLAYDRELRAGRFPTVERLAELAEVHPKTVRRDLAYLRDQYGAPVEFHRGRNGWHYADTTYYLPALVITEGELLALFLAGQVLGQHAGTPYEQDLKHAIVKLGELLPDQISMHWNAIEQAHSVRKSVTSLHDVDLFRRLADAVLHKRQLRLTYWTASRDSVTTRVVDPWHLACIDGDWYLIGWCHLRKARRMFVPARVRALEETGQTFTVPEDFRIGEFFDGTFRVIREEGQPLQKVRLRFAPTAAKYIREKIWHTSQVLHGERDGGVLLELALRSLVEVRRWILSWGSECEVLEPLSLRSDIAREAALIAARNPAATSPLVASRPARPRAKRHHAG